MHNETFTLHPRLAEDCVELGDMRLSRLLLMRDANFPWLILVPQRPGKRDLHDLDPMDQYRVCDEITRCSEGLQRLFDPDKINVAALGNMVPQLHIHVIARFTDDAAWPKPVWGTPAKTYEPSALRQRVEALRAELFQR